MNGAATAITAGVRGRQAHCLLIETKGSAAHAANPVSRSFPISFGSEHDLCFKRPIAAVLTCVTIGLSTITASAEEDKLALR